jgi:hypothetical protein
MTGRLPYLFHLMFCGMCAWSGALEPLLCASTRGLRGNVWVRQHTLLSNHDNCRASRSSTLATDQTERQQIAARSQQMRNSGDGHQGTSSNSGGWDETCGSDPRHGAGHRAEASLTSQEMG